MYCIEFCCRLEPSLKRKKTRAPRKKRKRNRGKRSKRKRGKKQSMPDLVEDSSDSESESDDSSDDVEDEWSDDDDLKLVGVCGGVPKKKLICIPKLSQHR